MAPPTALRLNLLENSHAFLREAVAKALAATSDLRQWQFAIITLVQCLELSLKAALQRIHGVLVYENIDNPKNTISSLLALQRLASPKIGAVTFAEKDRDRIQRAIAVRNELTHSEFELNADYAAAKFFEIFAFVSDFQRRHLGTLVSDIIPAAEFARLVQVRKLLDELVARARARIMEESIDSGSVWACPNCGEDTFIISNRADTCYACSHYEPVEECPQCSILEFSDQLESFASELETHYLDGQLIIINDFGYSSFLACPNCVERIREELADARQDEALWRLEEEYRDSRLR